MSKFEKTYSPPDVEEKWSSRWEENDAFSPAGGTSREPYSIVIPPPNVTGVLHVGHALNNTLQDILVRWQRMCGRSVLWVPGMDHAGIATQNVVEKQLAAEGTDRHQVGREKFLERVWEWKAESGGTILNQLKRLGCSCDWSRERFTLDEGLSLAVKEVFVSLHQDGLIYRDEKIINWCPRCHTALSDLEVEYHDQDGWLYHVKYPFVDSDKCVTVATTRPETIPGDTAIAVHPDDERYKDLIGSNVRLPVEPYRDIPVISDGDVDPSFGTGALKITPAHDATDFEIGRRHGLAEEQVIDKSGTMSEGAGKYRGTDRFQARLDIVEDLKKGGWLAAEEEYTVPLGHCYRCRSAVEPTLSPQWFVKVKPLAEEAIKAVEEKKTRIIPTQWEKTYFDWMNNIHDWCISRQIWWGHQIPVWYCRSCNRDSIPRDINGDGADSWAAPLDASPIVALEKPLKCPACGGGDLVQDPDVLDTWFSSALWPFSTLGWPVQTPLLETFYPTSVLVTSFDILFFWVARMMMMGLKFMGDVPFRDVYLHALVRDSDGQKMSKSKGNVIDPLGMMDDYGTDALRFTLAAMAAQGRDIKLSEERIAGYRNFVTKLWNASRLISMHLEDHPSGDKGDNLTLEDRWILSRLEKVVSRVDTSLQSYHFNDAASSLYQFAWHEFCDWYLEMIKERLPGEDADGGAARGTALHVLRRIVALLHPFMPFVTEEIHERLPGGGAGLVSGPFPVVDNGCIDEKIESEMEIITEIITTIRTIRGEMNIKPRLSVKVAFCNLSPEWVETIGNSGDLIKRLARVSDLDLQSGDIPRESAAAPLSQGELHIPLAGIVDFRAEVSRLEKEMVRLDRDISRCEKKLASAKFLERAPAEVVEKDRRILRESLEKKEYLSKSREKVLSWQED